MQANTPKFPVSMNAKRDCSGTDVPAFPPALIETVERLGVLIKARPRQQLAIKIDNRETAYILLTGQAMVGYFENGDRARVLNLLFAGDCFRSSFAPPLPSAALMANGPAEFVRLPYETLFQMFEDDVEPMRIFQERAARLQARMAMHVAVLTSLSGEERVATFLADHALRCGVWNGTQVSFELLLSRADMASYLALNADTLSRIMSRLKADGAIATLGRSRVMVRDFDVLLQRSPFADALVS